MCYRKKIIKDCPICREVRGRESRLEVQWNGDGEWHITCSDYSICNYSKFVLGHFNGVEFIIDDGQEII